MTTCRNSEIQCKNFWRSAFKLTLTNPETLIQSCKATLFQLPVSLRFVCLHTLYRQRQGKTFETKGEPRMETWLLKHATEHNCIPRSTRPAADVVKCSLPWTACRSQTNENANSPTVHNTVLSSSETGNVQMPKRVLKLTSRLSRDVLCNFSHQSLFGWKIHLSMAWWNIVACNVSIPWPLLL
jgi:hypothetical protein